MDHKTEQHKPTAEAIAKLLNGILEAHEYGAFDIALPNDGGKLRLTFDTYRAKNRVVVSGYWPSWMPPGKQWNEVVTPRDAGVVRYNEGYASEITASLDKSPEQIAKDIQRRLLPEYTRLRSGILAAIDSWQSSEARRAAIAERFVALGGGHGRDGAVLGDGGLYAESGGWRVDCIREAEGKVDLTLRAVPVEKALEIVKLLRSGQ